MNTTKNVRIGDILREYGYITEDQLQKALSAQKSNGKRLGDLLVEMGYVTDRQRTQALSKKLNLRMIDLVSTEADMAAVALLPQKLAEKYNMLPVAVNDQIITIATDDPLNFYAQEDIRQLTGKNLEIVLCEQQALSDALTHYYTDISVKAATQRANAAVIDTAEELEIEEGEGDAPIINLVDSLIERATSVSASDIHIEPFENKTVVRLRVDGTIVEYVNLQRSIHASVIARIKILGNMDIAERRIPQDGHFRYRLGDEMINIRVSVMPTVFGEKAVLRVLSGHSAIDYPASFGMTPENHTKMMDMMKSSNGIIYITGPTGSGKTTTLYMLLEYMSRKSVNICTVEDPVEKNLEHINQTQVNNVAGLTFESGMRALLRQDPDVIMVGETRDNETASISVRAAITGHLVFSTLHTNSAVSSIARLEDMGVEPYMVANSLVGIVAQRLIRKVCRYCSEDVPVTEAQKLLLGEGIDTVKKANGCPRCNNTGYSGRIAIHEILLIDKQIRMLIAKKASSEEIEEYAVKNQGLTLLKESGIQMVATGVTTLEELLKVAYYSI